MIETGLRNTLKAIFISSLLCISAIPVQAKNPPSFDPYSLPAPLQQKALKGCGISIGVSKIFALVASKPEDGVVRYDLDLDDKLRNQLKSLHSVTAHPVSSTYIVCQTKQDSTAKGRRAYVTALAKALNASYRKNPKHRNVTSISSYSLPGIADGMAFFAEGIEKDTPAFYGWLFGVSGDVAIKVFHQVRPLSGDSAKPHTVVNPGDVVAIRNLAGHSVSGIVRATMLRGKDNWLYFPKLDQAAHKASIVDFFKSFRGDKR